MKKLILISMLPLVQQIIENSKSKLVLDYIEYMILFFALSLAIIVMMLIPAVLFFSMIGNLISSLGYKKILVRGTDFKENTNTSDKSEYLNSLKKKYIKSHSNFCKYLSALAAWNIFSLLYILIGFESFKTGLIEYFHFPFYVFQVLNREEIYHSIYLFKSQGLIMLGITILTFLFYQTGKYFGLVLAKKNIKERNLNPVIG